MPKLSNAHTTIDPRPFCTTEVLVIKTRSENNKITGFDVTYNGTQKFFAVKKFNILAAWQQAEQWLKDVK